MYLLDTNPLIYAFKGQGRYRERIEATDPALLHLSTLSLFEIEFGLTRSLNPQPMRQYVEDACRRHVCLPFDGAGAIEAGKLRQLLNKAGTPIGNYDLLMAGIALARKMTFVTRNVREFSRVPGLHVEDWYD